MLFNKYKKAGTPYKKAILGLGCEPQFSGGMVVGLKMGPGPWVARWWLPIGSPQ